MNELRLRIGSRLKVTPKSRENHDTNRWVATSKSLPMNWTCALKHRATSDIVDGVPLTGWILDVDSGNSRVEVTDSNFGFLAISDRTRPRYITALGRLVEILDDPKGVREGDADALSEVKGMFSRCARRDQWDWHAVHVALGEPTQAECRRLSTALGQVAAAIRRGDKAAALADLMRAVKGTVLRRTLLRAQSIILNSAPKLTAPTAAKVPAARTETKRSRAPLSARAKKKLDSANATHAMLLDALGQFLGAHGHRVEANQFVDAYARLKSGPAIFEAKSITDENEMAQVRHGLSQLYEYRYRHAEPTATLWLLLSRPPANDWLIEYLEEDRDIHVIWLESGEFSGPCVGRLLESGAEARQRKSYESADT